MDIYGLLQERLETALSDLPRCRVRADAATIGMFAARLSPKDVESFAFASTIHDHPRFRRWCGEIDSNGKPWTRQRIRSCLSALVKIEFFHKMNEDNVCYYDEQTKSFRDSPNHFRFGPEYGAIFALAASSKTSSAPPSQTPSVQNSPSLTPAIRVGRDSKLAPLIVGVKGRVIFGRVRSDIIQARAARREAARDQHRLPLPIAVPPGGALAGMKLSAAALGRRA